MCAVAQATCEAHTDAWSSFAAFATPYARLATLRQAATDANALRQTSSEGATESKAILREALTGNMMQLEDTLVLWGMTTGNARQLAKDAQTAPFGAGSCPRRVVV